MLDEPLQSRGTRELAILEAVASTLHSSVDLPRALGGTLALVARLLGLQTGWVWLLDPSTDQFYLAASQNLPPYLQEPVRMSGRWCLCTDLFRQRALTPTNIDMLECTRLRPAIDENAADATLGLRYHASLPLSFAGRLLGIINVAGPEWRKMSSDELGMLTTIAYQAGIAVERARLAGASNRVARIEERARIAREIHDTLAQGLTAIGLDIEGALRHLRDNPDEARRRLDRALATSRANLDEARRSVLDLRAAPLAGRSLSEALADLARTHTSDTGVPVAVRLDDVCEIPSRVEDQLYRIAQEALTNAHRHSQATEIDLRLRCSSGAVVLTVGDNGQGLNPDKPATDRQGILGMRERARLVGGRVTIVSRAGTGTRVTARVPLPEDGE